MHCIIADNKIKSFYVLFLRIVPEPESTLYLPQLYTQIIRGILIAVFIGLRIALLPANEQVSKTRTPDNRNTQVDIKCHEDQH